MSTVPFRDVCATDLELDQ